MVEPRGLTPNPLLANSAPWHREASAPHVSRQQATVESAAELHRCRTSLGYSSPGCPRPAKCRFEHPSAVPVLSGPWQHSSSVSQTRPLLQGVAATRRSTGRGPFAGIDALSTRKQSCHGPVDDIEALPRHGGSTATQRASTVTVRRPSEARLPGKGFPDLGHGSQGDTAPACRCLEDVGGQAAPNPDGHRGNPELAAEPIQLVLLRLTAVQPSAARTAERAVIVSSTSRTPVGIHTVPTLVTHVSETYVPPGKALDKLDSCNPFGPVSRPSKERHLGASALPPGARSRGRSGARLASWARTGSAPRRGSTSPSGGRPTRHPRWNCGRRSMRREGASGYIPNSPKGALPTSSCRGAEWRSSWTAASGTGALTMAAGSRGRDPMLSCGPIRCAAMKSVTNGRRELPRSRVGAWFASGNARSALIPTAWSLTCSPDGVGLARTPRSPGSALSGVDSDAPHSVSPGASYRRSKLLSFRT